MASQTPTFEKDRIRALKNERISSQKKTFTKWMNSFLNKSNLHVNDLFEDLADGKILVSLLEIISGEKIGVAAHGKLRVHKIQNINRALDFLQKSVKLESIGAEDVIDGNEQLILGLVWMIILRFQIADISYEDEMSRERKSAKDALLLWCQRMTRGYPGVDIKNFTTSWRNGLAFNALIHKHRPDLIEYASLRPSQHEANLTNAFKVAEESLGITRLLDVEDVDCPRPDDRSVMTYVSAYYQFFAKMKSEETGGRRVAKIISVLMEIEEMEGAYESMVSDLLSWIHNKIKDMSKPFHKSLAAVKKEMIAFKHFRTIEKPPKYAERVNIEAHLFSLQTKRTANNQKPYIPPEGSYVKDVNMAWQEMESAEHDRALALRNELIRQEMLEKMADKFERKATLRESWLDDMMHVLEEERLAQDAATVEAALKRHEAISTDVKAREERFQMVFDLAQELLDEDYHRADAVRDREEVIMTKWDKLVNKLQGRRTTLIGLRDLVGVFRDMDSAHSDMMDIEAGLRSEDYGRHLLDVENLLQKHSLLESQIQAQGERIQKINAHALKFVNADHPETKVIKERQKLLTQAYQTLVQLGKERRARLEESLELYKFIGDLEGEDIFIKETEQLASSKEVGKDLASLTRLQQRHEALDAEISGRFAHCEQVCARGQSLIDKGHFASKEIKAKIKNVQANWIRVKELSQNRRERLKDAAQSLQYYSDANDAESWMKEKLSLVQSDDYGRDEQSATSLLQRHRQVQEEVSSFADDISRLKEQSKLMGESSKGVSKDSQPTYESYTEEMEVETDEEVEETIEKEVMQDVVREVKVPQVMVLYPYSGQGLAIEKGETLYLINKTNKDWWSVRRTKSKEAGYVPAKYVKEIEPRVVQKTTKQKVMVPQTVKVKKKVKKMVAVERQRPVPANTAASPRSPRRGKLKRGVKRHFTAHFDRDNVAVRQITLTNTYNKLVEASKDREQNLENAIKYYHFSRECDDMDGWMTNKEKQLNSEDSLQAGDVIQTIRKKLERFQTELSAKNSSMSDINRLADELITNGHYDSVNVKRRRKEVNERWGRLQQLNQQKEEELEEKHGVELFFTSCEEMQSWIKEKDGMLYDEDVGRDIETVRALQRRHQGVERDLAAVEDKVAKLKAQAQSLVSQHPRQARQIKTKEEEIIRLWNGLKTKAAQRKAVLDNAYGQQGFLADTRDLLSWASEVTQSLKTAEDPHDISSAEAMIQKHNEMLEDIQTHYDRFDRLHDYSQKLLSANPRAVKVKQNVVSLKEAKDELSRCWSERNDHLQQAQDLQLFIRDAEHLDAATASHEAYFANEDLGASVDDVERLLKKHEDMEKTLRAQDERVRDLSDMANSLIRADHFEKKWIAKRRDEVIQRRQAVKHRAGQRRQALVQSQILQNFLRDADEFGAWIFEKSQIATDESHRDPKNIQGKLQRHEAFEAEITANKDGIDRINTVGKNLIHKKHFGSKDIQKRLETLNQDWQNLLANSSNKGYKLHQAHQQMQFNRSLDDFTGWNHDVEAVLGSEDLGRDLSSVKFLLKKHQLVETDIEVHVAEAQALSRQAQELIDDDHFNAKDIQLTTTDVLRRFKDLKSLSASRRAQLEDSFGLNQLFYDIEMEMAWVREHEQLASSGDLGSNLVSVQRLQKRHLAFENELTNHEAKIESVLSCGQDLIDSCHHASERVEERIDGLRTAWGELLEAAAHRKLKLNESHESQKYFAEANEADSWMNDKAGLAASQDYGKDDTATEKLLTRHKALETDVESFSSVVTDLGKDARRLVQSGHFDAEKVKLMQRDLEEQLSGLRTLVSTRRLRLEESKKLHQYIREVDETAEWINEQLHIAGSEDYGKDFEHLEIIQNKFDDFQGSVSANTKSYRAVDNLAKRLVAEGHTDTVAIKEQQDILRSMWAQLQDQIQLRKKRLKSAAEIHRFNRDLNELISRIQEKDASLTLDDLGRDLASAQALQRKHDVFERELGAVEQQVKALINESKRLQNTYQGQTAQTILKHEQSVLGLWEELKRKSSRKKHKLRDSIALHKLTNAIRDQITWCIDMGRVISSDEPIHNLSDAEAMLRQLEEHHVVMESREETFTRLLETGEKMIEDGHFASEELTEKLELLLTERESLYATWDDRKTEVDQACDLHVFLRDARQVDSLYSSQEAVLAKAELGNSVDEVDFLLKKHENVEKLVQVQDEKVSALNTFGKQLIENQHNESSMISQRLTVINEKRNKLEKDLQDRRVKLEDSRKISQFYQDVIEAESWIVEKLQTALDECYKDPSNLDSKVQKHQAFEAELTAHRGVIDAVQRNGEELISSGHFAASEVESRIESLYIQWEELLEASDKKARKLEEARDHKKFNQEVDIADSCIADKEAIVSSEDIGRDYEHCIRLQKKMKEFDQDLAVDEDRVYNINQLADKLITQGHAGADLITQRQQALNERWDALQDKASERRQKLAEACEIHAFDRSCVDIANMINEKFAILSTDDLGRDLPGAEALIRRHDDVERALTVIENKMEMLESEALRLVRSQPHMARTVQTKQTEIIENWERLNDKFDERKSQLEANRLRQMFLVDYHDNMSWMSDLASKISSGELAKSVQDAQALLDLHKERKSEIEARQDTTNSTVAFGLTLVAQNNFAEEIQEDTENLKEMSSKLQELWADRQQMLQQSYELEVFLASAEQADDWITNKQSVAIDNESKDSLDTIESLLKNQVNFEKSIAAYEENVKSLENSAQMLIQKKHYDSDIIECRRDDVLEKWAKLKRLVTEKGEQLGESKLLFQFLRDAKELESWINEKLQTAAEASYREAKHLNLKLQKHQTFEAEVSANRGQLESVIKDGKSLISSSPNQRETTEKRLQDLSDLWTLLEDLSANKGKRLQEAIQKQTFERNVTELETWMDEIEYTLALKEYGRDLRSVKNLIKKHDLLEEDILNHEERVRDLLQQADEFEEAGHFQKEEIGERAADVADRFEQLSSPVSERKQKLEDSLVLHQLLNDAQAETDWLREKESLVSSEDYGHNLIGVQNLLKKHEAFEAELTSHEELIQSIVATANDVITRGHYASGVIMEHSSNLQTSWNEFQRLTQIRKAKLKESLVTQQYYSQVSEVEAWVQEKLPFVSNEDYGRDETSAQALLRRHETLELEFERYGKKINELRSLCNTLVLEETFDAENVKQRQRELEDRYSELSDISSYRHRRLMESCRLLNFLREVDEVEAWIEEKETIVTSDDCGRDLEHVDMLMEKFEAFTRDLVMSGERIAKLTAHAQELLDDEHSDSETIEKRAEQICTRWEVLKERTNERLEALDRAKDLHAFNRNVEETNAWIQEKETTLVHTEDGALDLSSVQALQRKHEGFQRDLKALGEKVSSLSQDADMLMDKLPQNRKHFSEQKQMIIEAWKKLQQRASSKKSVLSQSEGLQTFLNDYRDLMAWIEAMSSSIASREVAVDFAAAEKLFAQHQEYRTEVGAHEKSLQEFLEAAQKLIKSGHPNSKDIKEKSQSVQTSWVLLLESVGKKQDHLEQVKEVQRFKREADQLEGWLYARGSDILSEDVGDSLEAVEELLKKQDEFEKMLLAKGEHFEDLTKLTNQEVENEKLMKEKERELEKQKEMERQKKRKEKDRLEKERRKALREEEERKRKEIIEQQRQQEEKRRQEERREKDRAKQKEILEEQRQQEEKRRQEERREKEGAKRKEIVEQLRQQEERRRQEKLKQQKEMKRKQLDMEMKQEETKRKEREGNRNERQNKKIMEDKRKENQIEEAKVRPEQVSRQSSSPTQTVPRPICEGLLQRKQEFNERGQRPGIRAWQTFFVVLADGRLEFYSDKGAASRQEGYASPALDLKDATCTALDQELPGKNAFRLQLQNDSLFLFNTRSEKDYNQWIREINESIHKYSQVSQPHLESPRSPNALLATNGHGFSPKNEKHVRPLPTPMIKVTSFDGDEAIENDDNVHMYDDDDDDDDSVDLIDSFPESPPDVPPPLVPEDIDIDIEPDIPPPPHESHHSYPEDVPEEYTDVLSADDIHPEFYPDAPTDFNDNTIPDIPCIPPPDVPPFDLGDLEEGAVDDDDLIDYPKAPPPPVATFPKEPPALGVEETDYLSSSSEGVPSPPPPLVPTKPDVSNLPSRPHRKKRAPPPPREARYRSDSQDSDDFPTAVLPPKPPVKPKPKTVDSHDDKKHEKKKGMFGFFKKKK